MSEKLSRAELKKLTALKLKLDLQQKKLTAQKTKIAKEKKGLDSEKKKIASGWKELDRAKKKFVDEREVAAKQSLSTNMKSSRASSSSGSNKKYQDQFFEMKKRHDTEAKKARDYKRKLDQLEAENRVLRNKIKNLSGKRRGRSDDKRLRQLIRENRELRKRLRKMMKELNKRRRWYNRAIKIFKNNQNKWIKAQRGALKNKGLIIKYVFLDDIKYIKQFQRPRKGRDKIKFRNRVRVKTKGGGETTLKNVEIIVLDADDDENDDSDSDADDDNTVDGKNKNKKKRKRKKKGGADDGDSEAKDENSEDTDSASAKKKKRKKKKKGAAEDDEEVEKFMSELMSELGIANDAVTEDEEDLPSDIEDEEELDDDDNDDDEEDELDEAELDDGDEMDDADGDDNMSVGGNGGAEALSAQLLYLRQEMAERAGDLEKLQSVLSGDVTESAVDEDEDEEEAMSALMGAVAERQSAMEENLTKLDSADIDVAAVREGNDEWRGYLLRLSEAIAGNASSMGRVLSVVRDGFLKELEGRRMDLGRMHGVFYEEEGVEEVGDEAGTTMGMAGVKEDVDERHAQIREEVQSEQGQSEEREEKEKGDGDGGDGQGNGEKISALLAELLATNVRWNELIAESAVMHGESQATKNGLVEQLMSKYAQMQEWTAKVQQMPATKLL